MSQSFLEINRIDAKTRATLNSILRDNRIIFEQKIIKDVRALLNANKATLELEEKKNILDKLTFSRRKRDRERFANATSSLQTATNHAPMGVGAGVGLALQAANTANQLYYENHEQKILEKSAEESLNAAKFQMYTSKSDNYTLIARSVARELSFTLQPLLLLLASGANGIIKLANFMQKSRQKYAIEKLPEYHSTNSIGEIVSALVDASIPPVTDDTFYRDFFKIDIYNLNIQFANHTPLDFNPEVRDLLKLAGLEIEIFFGSLSSEYTIIGALTHSVFLGQNYQLYAGIENAKRAREISIGTIKYPLRLIPPGKNIGTAGASFALRPTGIYIEEAHKELLKKLFPNFTDPEAVKVSAEEISKDEVILPDYSTRLYRSERNSVPWNIKRTEDKKNRLDAVLSANLSKISDDEIVSIPDYSRLKSMRDAGDWFDINYSKNEILQGLDKSNKVRIAAFAVFDKLERTRNLLASAKYSKYLAVTTWHHIYCIIKCEKSTMADLIFAADMLDAARTTLNLSRNYSYIETYKLIKAKNASKNAFVQFNDGLRQQLECYKNLKLFLDNFHDTIINQEFLQIIPRLIALKKKNLNKDIEIVKEDIGKIITFIKALTNKNLINSNELIPTEIAAIANFNEIADILIQDLYALTAQNSIKNSLQKVEICALEVKMLHYQIASIFKKIDLEAANFHETLESIDAELNKSNASLVIVQNIVSDSSWIKKKTTKINLMTKILEQFSVIKQVRDNFEKILQGLSLAEVEDLEIANFQRRIEVYNKLGRLLYITNNFQELNDTTQKLIKSISILYRAIEQKIQEDLTSYENQIQEFQNISQEKQMEDLYKTYISLKSIQCKMELSFANDAELLTRTRRQSQQFVEKIRFSINELLDIDEGILTIIEKCESKLFALNITMETNHLEQIKILKTMLLNDKELDIDANQRTLDVYLLIKQIIKNTITETNTDISSLITREIVKLLDDLTQKNISYSAKTQSMNQEDVRTIQSLTLSEIRQEEPINGEIWEIWIIFKLLQITMQQVFTGSANINNKLKTSVDLVNFIQNEIEDEHHELIHARAVAINKIKQTYHYINHAQEEKSKLTAIDSSYAIAPNILISSNLAWAARPTFNELKYLDKKQESLRKSRFEAQQKHKNNTLIINPLLIRYIKVGIEYLKKQEDGLNKLHVKIKNDLDNIYRLQPPTVKQQLDQNLTNVESRLSKLESIVAAKLELLSKKIKPLEKFKQDFTKQILGAYFGYLKLEVDILESETYNDVNPESPRSQTLKKFFKPNFPKKSNVVYEDNSIIKAAKKFSLSALESHYNDLADILNKNTNIKYTKSSVITDNNSDQSDERFFSPAKDLKLSQTKLSRASSQTSSNDLSLFSTLNQSLPEKSLITEVNNSKKIYTTSLSSMANK